uniref:Pickpocket n=1 Tax=Anopheles epiroticus TaxID=199890 RepID=A0A182PJH0_9DIPT
MTSRAELVRAKIGALFEEYCSESSVHGVRFFVGSQRNACVKATWLSVFILSLVGCGMMIQQAYNKWDQTPVIVTLSEVPTPVWDMHFPAITICPEIKVLKTKYNFTQEFETLQSEWYGANRGRGNKNVTYSVSEESIGKLKAIMQHCSGIYKYENNFMFNFNHVPEPPHLLAFLKSVALDRRDVFTLCSSTSDARCTDYMQVTLTNEGICYSFNMISQERMFRPDVLHNEYKYLEPWDANAGPVEQDELLKVAGSGLDAAIGFNLIHYPLQIDTSCVYRFHIDRRPSLQRGRGYRVLIHEPTTYPDLSKRNIRLSLSQTLTVALKPNIMMTSPQLEKYSAQKRQCYFEHEHPLRFFRRYNQDNCELECLTNYTLERCGCVHFSMPRANGTRVCRFEEAHCPYDVRRALFIRKQNRTSTDDYLLQCDCLPACSSVRFDLQITEDSHTEEREVRTRFETEEELQAKLVLPAYSMLQVYFQDTHFIPAQRSELHGLVDFLANCGGLLGLFIGVSLLSIHQFVRRCICRSALMAKLGKRLRGSVRAEVFREYCANSSIHGVRYLDRNGRSACERFWWLVVFLFSMLGCSVMIHKTYVKWKQVPIIVTFSEKTTPVWDIHFPAITICPETKVSAEKLNLTAEMNALSREMDRNNGTIEPESLNSVHRLKVVAQLCHMLFHLEYNWLREFSGPEDNIVDTLKNMSLSRDETLVMCRYGNNFEACEDRLTETLTEEGICYTFNMRHEDEIFRKGLLQSEYNYTEDWFDSAQQPVLSPLHARGAGLHDGLTLYMRHKQVDTDYMCTGFSQGYKLLIHSSDEYPQVSVRNMRIPFSHEISIALRPQMIVTSQSATDYSWEKRQCFFDHERYLRFFRLYNQDNCELECLSNVTEALCGCVRFSMPRSNDTKVCPLTKWHCMHRAKWYLRPNNDPFVPDNIELDITKIANSCNCLPACSSVYYDVETTQTSLDTEKFMRANNDLKEYESDKFFFTTLSIFFKESYFITSKRSELYGWVDFLANCGGLLGLFMGVSILSLLEICYYITIRPFSVKKRLVMPTFRKCLRRSIQFREVFREYCANSSIHGVRYFDRDERTACE